MPEPWAHTVNRLVSAALIDDNQWIYSLHSDRSEATDKFSTSNLNSILCTACQNNVQHLAHIVCVLTIRNLCRGVLWTTMLRVVQCVCGLGRLPVSSQTRSTNKFNTTFHPSALYVNAISHTVNRSPTSLIVSPFNHHWIFIQIEPVNW